MNKKVVCVKNAHTSRVVSSVLEQTIGKLLRTISIMEAAVAKNAITYVKITQIVRTLRKFQTTCKFSLQVLPVSTVASCANVRLEAR
jgi:hypothetical protein